MTTKGDTLAEVWVQPPSFEKSVSRNERSISKKTAASMASDAAGHTHNTPVGGLILQKWEQSSDLASNC